MIGRRLLFDRLLPLVVVLAGLVLLAGSLLQLLPALDQWRQTSAASKAFSSRPEGLEGKGTAGDEYVVEEPGATATPLLESRAIDRAAARRLAAGSNRTAEEQRSSASTKRAPAPASVGIPDIGVQTRLVRLGLNPDRSLQVPSSYALAGWYTRGAAPGEDGPAVIVGHYDSVDGPAVFYRLSQLRPGEQVQVRRADGSVAKFSVDRVERFSKEGFPTDEVYGRVNRPELRLITCGGSFDYSTRHYRENYVVFAHMT